MLLTSNASECIVAASATAAACTVGGTGASSSSLLQAVNKRGAAIRNVAMRNILVKMFLFVSILFPFCNCYSSILDILSFNGRKINKKE